MFGKNLSRFEAWQKQFSDGSEASNLMNKALHIPTPNANTDIPKPIGAVPNALQDLDLDVYSKAPHASTMGTSDEAVVGMYQNAVKDTLKIFQGLESAGKNLAPNASGYEGVYQFRYRQGDLGTALAKEMGVTPQQVRGSRELQEQMMVKALGRYKKDLTRNGIPINNLNLYLVHNQGLGGTKAIYNTLHRGAKLSPKIRRNILNQFGQSEKAKLGLNSMSDKQLANAYYNKFSRKVKDYTPRSSGTTKPKSRVVDTARSMLGAKYQYGASTKATNSADCSSLTQKAVAKAGKSIPRTAQGQYNHFKKQNKLTKNTNNAKSGDIVFFDFKNHNGNRIGHTAVISKASGGKLTIIEASGGHGKVIERPLPAGYYKHIAGIGQV